MPSNLLFTEHQDSAASKTGGEPILLDLHSAERNGRCPQLSGLLSAVEAPGCRAGVSFAPRPHHRALRASVAHPHSTEGPEGSPILTPGCKLRKYISKVWGLAGKHPAGRAMQSPGLAANWPNPRG